MTCLTKKEVQFEWSDKCQERFQKFKTLLIKSPIFALHMKGNYFVIYCDTLHSNLGAILMQEKRAITYASTQLKVHEKNYHANDLELIVVVFALKI